MDLSSRRVNKEIWPGCLFSKCGEFFLDCIILYCTVLYHTVLYYIILYCIILHRIIRYCMVPIGTVAYCSILYCNILQYTITYSTSVTVDCQTSVSQWIYDLGGLIKKFGRGVFFQNAGKIIQSPKSKMTVQKCVFSFITRNALILSLINVLNVNIKLDVVNNLIPNTCLYLERSLRYSIYCTQVLKIC